jgi:hypothetical protein
MKFREREPILHRLNSTILQRIASSLPNAERMLLRRFVSHLSNNRPNKTRISLRNRNYTDLLETGSAKIKEVAVVRSTTATTITVTTTEIQTTWQFSVLDDVLFSGEVRVYREIIISHTLPDDKRIQRDVYSLSYSSACLTQSPSASS